MHTFFLLLLYGVMKLTLAPVTLMPSSVIHAYPVPYSVPTVQPVQKVQSEKKKIPRALLKRTYSTPSPQKKPHLVSQPKTRAVTNRAPVAFITLLHQRIQAEQVYPLISQEMHHEGVVTVSFLLTPKGEVEDLQVKTPSVFSPLNAAALLAVQQAAPFVEASDFIREKQRFQVDIEFKIE